MGILSAKKLGSDREKDFSKKKRRVGKTAPDQKNYTKTIISTKSLIIPQQNLRVLKDDEDATLIVTDILEKTTHHSGAMRAEVFNKLGLLFTRRPEIIVEHVQHLIPHFGESMSDEDPIVRSALCNCLYAHLPSITPSKIYPFFDMLLQYVLAALNNILHPIRDDAIHYIRLIVVLYPEHLSSHALTLLINLSGLLAEKELFAARTSSLNKFYSFPTAFVGCKLSYWAGIYEHCVAINRQDDLSGDLSTSLQTLSTHQQTLNDIKDQLAQKQKRNSTSPYLDNLVTGFSTHQKDLSEQSLLYLPNNTSLTYIQTLLFTIEIILKHCLPQNLTTLVSCLLAAQSTNRFQISSQADGDSIIALTKKSKALAALVSTAEQNEDSSDFIAPTHTHIQSTLQEQITFHHGTSTRDELLSTLTFLAPMNTTSTSPSQFDPKKQHQQQLDQKSQKSQLTADNQQQIVVAQSLTNPTHRVAAALQIQPILSSVLRALLSCWETYAPLEWSPARKSNLTGRGEERDIYEQADQASTFASHSIKASANGPSQRHKGKLKSQGSNSVSSSTPPPLLQHSYSLLISVIASVYYLSHLDLQCRTNQFSMTINQSQLFQDISTQRISEGKTFLLPFFDLPHFNIFQISPLQFFPFHTTEKQYFSYFAHLNLWTSKLISLLIPCVPLRLNPQFVTDTLLTYQVSSLKHKFDQISQQYFHIKNRVQLRLKADDALRPSKEKLLSEAAERDRVKLLNKYGVKTGTKNKDDQSKELKTSEIGSLVADFQRLSKFEPFLLNKNVANQNTDPLYVTYKQLYVKFHRQLQAMDKYSTILSQQNEDLYTRCDEYYELSRLREKQLIGFVTQSLQQYQTEEQSFVDIHYQRAAKYVEQEAQVTDINDNTSVGSSKRKRQILDHDDDEDEEDRIVLDQDNTTKTSLEFVHQTEEDNDNDGESSDGMTDSSDLTDDESEDSHDELEDQFNAYLQGYQIPSMNDGTNNDEDLTSTLQFRDFLDLFWEVIPSLSPSHRLHLLQSYTTFYQSLSSEPLSTIKVLAALPLLLYPRVEYEGEQWFDEGLSKQWIDSFPSLIQSAIRVATFQKGAWLLTGSTGHKLLKQINWQFILSAIGTSISYVALKFNSAFDNQSPEDCDTVLDTNPDVKNKKNKASANQGVNIEQSSGLYTSSVFARLLIDRYTTKNDDSKSITNPYQINVKYGALIDALQWSLDQSAKGLAVPVQFFQTFIPLLVEQLLFHNELDQHVLSVISYIITTQLTFPQSVSVSTTILDSTTTPLLSPSSCQYLQDITLLHPTLSSEQQLSFLFASSLSTYYNILTKPSIKTISFPLQSSFSALGSAPIATNFILHILRLCSREPRSFFISIFKPLLATQITQLTQYNIWNPSFNTMDYIDVLQSNASKIMQLLSILHIFYTSSDNQDDAINAELFKLIKPYATWYILSGFGINQLAKTPIMIQNDAETIQTASSAKNQLTSAALYVSKFQRAKQENTQLSFSSLNSTTIEAIQQYSPHFHPHTTHHNTTKYLTAINSTLRLTSLYSTSPSNDQLGSHLAFALFSPPIIGLDNAPNMKNSAFLWQLLITIHTIVSKLATNSPTIPKHLKLDQTVQDDIKTAQSSPLVVQLIKDKIFNIEHIFQFFTAFFSILPIQTTFLQLITEQADGYEEAMKSHSGQKPDVKHYTPIECIFIQLCYYGQHISSPKYKPNGELSFATFSRFCALIKNLAPMSAAFLTDSFEFQ